MLLGNDIHSLVAGRLSTASIPAVISQDLGAVFFKFNGV
jgi:hypothetical protein